MAFPKPLLDRPPGVPQGTFSRRSKAVPESRSFAALLLSPRHCGRRCFPSSFLETIFVPFFRRGGGVGFGFFSRRILLLLDKLVFWWISCYTAVVSCFVERKVCSKSINEFDKNDNEDYNDNNDNGNNNQTLIKKRY